jgi:hypothetical protein
MFPALPAYNVPNVYNVRFCMLEDDKHHHFSSHHSPKGRFLAYRRVRPRSRVRGFASHPTVRPIVGFAARKHLHVTAWPIVSRGPQVELTRFEDICPKEGTNIIGISEPSLSSWLGWRPQAYPMHASHTSSP